MQNIPKVSFKIIFVSLSCEFVNNKQSVWSHVLTGRWEIGRWCILPPICVWEPVFFLHSLWVCSHDSRSALQRQQHNWKLPAAQSRLFPVVVASITSWSCCSSVAASDTMQSDRCSHKSTFNDGVCFSSGLLITTNCWAGRTLRLTSQKAVSALCCSASTAGLRIRHQWYFHLFNG